MLFIDQAHVLPNHEGDVSNPFEVNSPTLGYCKRISLENLKLELISLNNL